MTALASMLLAALATDNTGELANVRQSVHVTGETTDGLAIPEM